ncbi:MAG: NAD(P)-dependent oxidoreductase, partial [Sinobacteraceae bacterium]|nr:NAD(P)-dependent oxidoreductase [Nevskiaceae bacterium]
MSARTVCLIGFGEVGQTLAKDLTSAGIGLAAWDVQFPDPDSLPSRALPNSGVRAANSAANALRDASVIISAVTAADCVAAAENAAPLLNPDSYFLDLNSVSPATKVAAHAQISRGAGQFVEAAVMSPIQPAGVRSPILTGGPHAAAFLPIAQELGFARMSVVSDAVGRASASKMCRSVMIKGVEALLTESLATARHYGVEEAVLDSLGELLPARDWRALSSYMIRRSLQHGRRRAAEMREVAVTVRGAGVTPWMSEATVARQDWAAERMMACTPEP